MAALFGADEPDHLSFGVQFDAISFPIPVRRFPAKGQHPLLFVDRVLVVDRDLRLPAKLVDHALGGRVHRVADSEADDIHAFGAGLVDLVPQGDKKIGGNFG